MLAHGDETAPRLRVGEVYLRHPLVVPHAVVAAGVGPGGPGIDEEPAFIARERAVFHHVVEGRPVEAAVVENAVQQYADAARVRAVHQLPEVLRRPEGRVHAVVVYGVVLVVGYGGEHRRQVQAGRPQVGYVVELAGYPPEVAAHEILARRRAAPGHGARRVERLIAVGEALGEDLIVDLLAAPAGGGVPVRQVGPEEFERAPVHRRLFALEALRIQPEALAVHAPELKAVAYIGRDALTAQLRREVVAHAVPQPGAHGPAPPGGGLRLIAPPVKHIHLRHVARRRAQAQGKRFPRARPGVLQRGPVDDRRQVHAPSLLTIRPRHCGRWTGAPRRAWRAAPGGCSSPGFRSGL